MSGRESGFRFWHLWTVFVAIVALALQGSSRAEARAPAPLPTPQLESIPFPQEPLRPGPDGSLRIQFGEQTYDLHCRALSPDAPVALSDPGLVRLFSVLNVRVRPNDDAKGATLYASNHYIRWNYGATSGIVDGRPVSWADAMTSPSPGEIVVSLRALSQFLAFRLQETATPGTYAMMPLVERIEMRQDGGDRRLVVLSSCPIEASATTQEDRLQLVVPGARWGFAPRDLRMGDVTVHCEGTGTSDDPIRVVVETPAFWKAQLASQMLPNEVPVRVAPVYVAQPGEAEHLLSSLVTMRSGGEGFAFADLDGAVRHFWSYDPQSRELVIEMPQVKAKSSLSTPAPCAEIEQVQWETLNTACFPVLRLRMRLASGSGFEVRMTRELENSRLVIRVASQATLPLVATRGGDDLLPEGTGRGVIVIDPGHGGGDPGAVNRAMGLQEKTITLDIALRLKELLVRRGWKVRLTRESDRDVSWVRSPDRIELGMRAEVAREVRADLFVSIHCNASVSSGSNGTSYHWFKSEDLNLARSLVGALSHGTGLIDRGLSRDRFFLLRHTRVPAVLVETAFISNPTDAARLADQAIRQKIAENLAEALSLHMAREAAQRLQGSTGR